MACGCGGTSGGTGGCGGDKPLANPLLETELAHELPQAAASAVVEFDPEQVDRAELVEAIESAGFNAA